MLLPMVMLLIEETAFPDPQLKTDVGAFPLVGALPPCGYSCELRPPKPKGEPISVEQLRSSRHLVNQVVLAGLKEMPYSEDLLTLTREDAEQGFMEGPVPLASVDLTDITLTRRIPVRGS